jgi:hypothetical protein
MEHYGADINDRSSLLPGGKQRIVMDGYQIPLDIVNGLPYLRCRKPTDDELAMLPHIIMTADVEWNPNIYDHTIDNMETFYDETLDVVDYDHNFNPNGEYKHRTIGFHELDGDMVAQHCFAISPNNTKPDFQLLRPLFGWFPTDTIRRTFDVTTKFARGRVSDTLKQHWRSRFPACNVKRRNEPVATDTVFSDTPAVDCGVTAAQLFVGRESLVADVYGLKTDK